MRRHLSLRQIEAFKAVIEHGTISRAAGVMLVSQPAMSKMISNLEEDAGLVLFDRLKGRLAPTQQAMRLYDEIDRIFAGVRQVENAIDSIRREGQGRIAIGVLPALSGSFVQQVTTEFLRRYPQAFCVIEGQSSQRITEWLVTHKLDVGFVSTDVDNPYLQSESLLEHALVCIMPAGHALAKKKVIQPADLNRLPFVSFDPETSIGHRVATMLAQYKINPEIVLVVNGTRTLCELVAAGHGVSLTHPLEAKGLGNRLAIRRFKPAMPYDIKLSRSKDGRYSHLVTDFVDVARETARRVSAELRRS